MKNKMLRFLLTIALSLLILFMIDTVNGFRVFSADDDVPVVVEDDDDPAAEILAVPCVSTLAQCPQQGCGGDPLLNSQKNITSDATNPFSVPIAYIVWLNTLSPTSWSSGSSRGTLQALGEGAPVQVVGYLIGAHVTSTPESTNCFLTGTQNNDFHLNLAPSSGAPLGESLVAEITPRFRPVQWTLPKFSFLAAQNFYVRVTGWLMFDSQHARFVPSTRASAWEIHPVTAFELCLGSISDCDAGLYWAPLEVL